MDTTFDGDEAIRTAERLLTEPYPEAGYHWVDLRTSETFFDDEDGSAANAAGKAFEADLKLLESALTQRFGPPERVNLRRRRAADPSGTAMPPLAFELSNVLTHVDVWDGGARPVAAGVSQVDEEFEFQLFVAVGEF